MKPHCQRKVSYNDNAHFPVESYASFMSGNRLKYIREQMGLTLEAFGERVGATKGQISKLENEKQPFNERWFRAFEQALNIPRWHLFVDPETIYGEEYQRYQSLMRGLDSKERERALEALEMWASGAKSRKADADPH